MAAPHDPAAPQRESHQLSNCHLNQKRVRSFEVVASSGNRHTRGEKNGAHGVPQPPNSHAASLARTQRAAGILCPNQDR